MKHSPLLAFLCLPAVLGCQGPTSEPSGGDGKADSADSDGKADSADRGGEVRCLVVEVLDKEAVEEGLTAIFDVDKSGLLDGDAGGTSVHIAPALGRVELGHLSFSRANGDQIVAVAADPDADNPHRAYQITSGEERYEIRVFTKSGLGTVTMAEGEKAAKRVATLDCRSSAKAPNEDDAKPAARCAGTLFESGRCRFRSGSFASAVCCKPSCDVASVDDDLLEEGFGALYDIDADGATNSDEDATFVRSDFTTGELEWRLGNHRFAAAGGDTLEHQAGLESYFQRFLIHSAAGEDFEVRIFDVSRLGVVLVKEAGDSAARVLGRLDCRGRKRPAIVE